MLHMASVCTPCCMLLDVRGGSRIFFSRGCTRLLLYFNTNKPHSSLFFLQNTSCIRKPQVISGKGGGVRTPCTLPLDPPLDVVAVVAQSLKPVRLLAPFKRTQHCLKLLRPFARSFTWYQRIGATDQKSFYKRVEYYCPGKCSLE